MSILYTHCAQCSTMGLTRVTLQYKILHLWERQHKEKIRECQSCHSKWYCCNMVLLLWCTLKIPQQRYWLCLIFLCVCLLTSSMASFSDSVVKRVLHFKRVYELCVCQICFVPAFLEEEKKKEGKCRGQRSMLLFVCLPSNHQKVSSYVAGSLMWVWWGPPPPVPFPLVLISQVDEHISSSPNPSPCIPPHMSTMHTNRHTCVDTTHVRESRVTWCTGHQWKSNNNKKSVV